MKPRIPSGNLLFILFSCMLLTVISCSKENSSSDSEEMEVAQVSSESDAEAESIYNGIFDDVMGVNDDVGMAGTGVFGRLQRPMGCQTVTITRPTANPFPVRVVIDFGPVPCMGQDGHTRKGKIIAEYTNRLIMPGATVATTFENFYFDSIHVEGTHKITNSSSPINTQPPTREFKMQVIDGKLTNYNNNFIEWNSTKTITQIEGLILTPDRPLDDVFRIEGGSRGRAQRGNLLVGWQSNVVEPLIKRFACRWISKGIIRSVRLNSASNTPWVAMLNFGNGQCDRQAELTINGVSHQITLR